jgi:hypothetical protein
MAAATSLWRVIFDSAVEGALLNLVEAAVDEKVLRLVHRAMWLEPLSQMR